MKRDMKRNIFVKSLVWRVSSVVSVAREHKSDKRTTAISSVAGVRLFGGPRASKSLNIPETCSFHHEYNSIFHHEYFFHSFSIVIFFMELTRFFPTLYNLLNSCLVFNFNQYIRAPETIGKSSFRR